MDDVNKLVRRYTKRCVPVRRVSEDERMGGLVIHKRSEMLNNPIERDTHILGSLKVSDDWDETVIGYDSKDASRSKSKGCCIRGWRGARSGIQ